jgi:twitching motility protein PilI
MSDFAEPSQHPLVPPSQALNRFEPPAGFAPVATEVAAKQVRYGFRAIGLSFLIRERVPSEVVPMMPFAAIPNGPGWLLGMINLHGNLVPVCDLGRVLGGDAAAGSAKPMILVLDKGDKAAGFVIDGYPFAVTGLRQASQVPGLSELLRRHVTDTLATENEVWLEFDHEGFLEEANRQ